jgi:hypothetical protein
MSFWTDFEHFIKDALDKIGDEVVHLVTLIKPIVVAGAEEVATAALNAVMAEAPKVISGAEKFDSAVSNVVTGLAGRGKAVAATVAAAAVQTAYNELSALLHKE